MSKITTHVLDTSIGRPAAGVPVTLEKLSGQSWSGIGSGRTDSDGRLRDLLPADRPLEAGDYRLSFDTAVYFSTRDSKSFYPSVTVTFRVEDPAQHYHVPLLVNPFGYSTYRGS